jgi:hypothetical protein
MYGVLWRGGSRIQMDQFIYHLAEQALSLSLSLDSFASLFLFAAEGVAWDMMWNKRRTFTTTICLFFFIYLYGSLLFSFVYLYGSFMSYLFPLFIYMWVF